MLVAETTNTGNLLTDPNFTAECECAISSTWLCSKHFRDKVTGKTFKVVWSLSNAKDFHGELPAVTEELKQRLTQDAILVAAMEKDPRWKRFL